MKSHPRALLFSGILYAEEEYLKDALYSLVSRFGPLRHESTPVPWHSGHYSAEMGSHLKRKFVFFRELVRQDGLMEIKNLTRSVEAGLSVEGRRTVNLDPGLLAPARVVLATTKDYAHRIYLGEGIYAEATLLFRGGRFVPGDFAYSDYAEEPALKMFGEMRAELMKELNGKG